VIEKNLESELNRLRVALGRIKDLPHAAPEALAEIAREALEETTSPCMEEFMNYESIAKILYETHCDGLKMNAKPWEMDNIFSRTRYWSALSATDRTAWIVVAKRAHEIIAAAVLA
jgi:hypothetical protein